MSFKIGKSELSFALTLTSKALAQRQQEEVIYRAVRITTFEQELGHYVMFSTNGGFNAIITTGFEVSNFKEDVDVLVECQKLLEVIDRSSVEEITIEKIDDENLMVFANGENKLRYLPGEIIAEFPGFNETNKLGEMKVKSFVNICKLTSPFATDDIHKAPLIGLCIDKNNIYATDELKSMTQRNIGLEIPIQLNFNPIAAEMVKMFGDDRVIQFYLGKMTNAMDYTHLTLVIDGVRLFILKYQSEYPVDILDITNKNCVEKNTNIIKLPRISALQTLNRLGIFADENDILALTAIDKGVVLEVINAKTSESSKELIEAEIKVSEDFLNKAVHTSLANFITLLTVLENEEIAIAFSDIPFISVNDSNFTAFVTTKNVE